MAEEKETKVEEGEKAEEEKPSVKDTKKEVKEDKKEESPKEEKKEDKADESSSSDDSDKASEEELSPEMEELAEKYKKLISEIEKLSVVELAELVKVLEKKFGVSSVAPVAATSAGGEEEEKDSFNLLLKAPGDLKINVIKVVREITGLGLKESKELVDGAPKVIKEGLKKEEANELKKKLEETGATVELE